MSHDPIPSRTDPYMALAERRASDEVTGKQVTDRPSERNQKVSEGAAKFDASKVRVDLVPSEFIFATAAVLTYGEIKYAAWNWAKGLEKGRIMAAMMRHAMSYMVGENVDKESGLPHTWHMAACLAILIASEARGTAIEDREMARDAMIRMEKQFAEMNDPKGLQ